MSASREASAGCLAGGLLRSENVGSRGPYQDNRSYQQSSPIARCEGRKNERNPAMLKLRNRDGDGSSCIQDVRGLGAVVSLVVANNHAFPAFSQTKKLSCRGSSSWGQGSDAFGLEFCFLTG